MKIVLKKTSLIDYPEKIAAVFFFPGCNLRCPWCQNRELAAGIIPGGAVDIEEGLAHIEKRRLVLDGVVLSGGEASIYPDLPSIIETIKKTGLKVKLDTNGMKPEMLKRLYSREETSPDYTALDLKLAPKRYVELARGLSVNSIGHEKESLSLEANLIQSAAIISDSGLPHEYRTLALPGGFISETDVEALSPLADYSPWYFRTFKPGNCLDPAWNNYEEAAPSIAERLALRAGQLGKNAVVPERL